jgi:hypothetical protein
MLPDIQHRFQGFFWRVTAANKIAFKACPFFKI